MLVILIYFANIDTTMVSLVGNKIGLILQVLKMVTTLCFFLPVAITITAELHYHSYMVLLIIYIIG